MLTKHAGASIAKRAKSAAAQRESEREAARADLAKRLPAGGVGALARIARDGIRALRPEMVRGCAWALRKLKQDGDAKAYMQALKIAWEIGGDERAELPGSDAIDVTPDAQDMHALVLKALSGGERAEETARTASQDACGETLRADSTHQPDAAQLNEDASTTRCELHPTPQRSGTPSQTGEGAIQDSRANLLSNSPLDALFEGTDDCDCAVGRCVCGAHLSVGDDEGGPAEGGEGAIAAVERD